MDAGNQDAGTVEQISQASFFAEACDTGLALHDEVTEALMDREYDDV